MRDWRDALVTVVCGTAAMAVTAALGLWAAGAAGLPGGAFPRVVAAVVVMAAGGTVELTGDAGDLVGADAELAVLPLSVTLAGALVTGAAFLGPLRHHAVSAGGELLGRAVRTAVLWSAALAALSTCARDAFEIPLGEESPADLFGELFDSTPTVGFRADLPSTLLFGLLWLLGVLAVTLLVSRGAPLPARLLRYQEQVRPAAFAMLFLLLACVAAGVVVALVAAATRGHPSETFAVMLLGLPNLVWLALGIGMGGSWEGRVEGPFGLPVPHLLDAVLRGERNSTLSLSSLVQEDGRAWWLLVAAAVLLQAAAFVMAVRSPAGTSLWLHAAHMAIALTLTTLVVCPLTGIDARAGLSLLGIGDLGGFGGEVTLRPRLWATAAAAALWGLVTGFLGGLLASRVRRGGEVDGPLRPEPGKDR
ncbi:streptophobe family protein [Streptomyces sp. GC420]|uniref:streptophobe family protein n=1 Tax=Streptomyces sp. GC420 TaxID=2697568 RepID=UPI001414F0DC|nr:streptophobe family protein [Streptomyces sp. GC420]NBM18124.1 hypothetical protein [Streptomyces sp. GC420]